MPPKYKRKLIALKDRILPHLPLIVGFVALVIIGKLLTSGVAWLQKHGLTTNFFRSIITDDPSPLVKSYKGRTNILLLGIAGGDHPGWDLTDTMIFASIALDTKDALMISLPRDIWSPTLQDKINSAYHYGEEKKKNGGFVLAKSITEEVLGQPVHYAILIDFAGFKDAIDALGGIEIDVPEAFVDRKFPLPGKENDNCDGDPEFTCRYETIKFKQGHQLMDGETALKYVRSRNAEGQQGTDFARSQRQQQVMQAFMDKATSLGILANPLKIRKIHTEFSKSVKIDAQLSEMLALAKVATDFQDESLRKVVLDGGDLPAGRHGEEQEREGWLYTPPTSRYGRWVLLPRGDSFEVIHNLVACHLESPTCDMQPEDY